MGRDLKHLQSIIMTHLLYRFRIALALGLGLAATCARTTPPSAATSAAAQRSYVYPIGSWERWPSPEAAGYRSAGLDSARIMLSALPSTGLIAIVGGKELMEYGDIRVLSYLASVR